MCRNGTKKVSYKDWNGSISTQVTHVLQRIKCTRCNFICYEDKPVLFENFRITKKLEEEIVRQCLITEFSVIAQNLGLSAKTIRNVWINRQEKQFEQIGWNEISLLRKYKFGNDNILLLQGSNSREEDKSSSLKGVFTSTTSAEFQQWLGKHPGGSLYVDWNLVEICKEFLPAHCVLCCTPESIAAWIEDNLENFIRKAKNNWNLAEKNNFESIKNIILLPFVTRSVADDLTVHDVCDRHNLIKGFVSDLDELRSLFTKPSVWHAERAYRRWVDNLSVISREVFSSAIRIVNRVSQHLFAKEWSKQIKQCYLNNVFLPKIRSEYKVSKLVGTINHWVCNPSDTTQYTQEKVMNYNYNFEFR